MSEQKIPPSLMRERDLAAIQYTGYGYGCDGDTSADSFKKGYDACYAKLTADAEPFDEIAAMDKVKEMIPNNLEGLAVRLAMKGMGLEMAEWQHQQDQAKIAALSLELSESENRLWVCDNERDMLVIKVTELSSQLKKMETLATVYETKAVSLDVSCENLRKQNDELSARLKDLEATEKVQSSNEYFSQFKSDDTDVKMPESRADIELKNNQAGDD